MTAKHEISRLARLARCVIRMYQLTLSPAKYALFGPSCGCRFYPTCSCYAREALARHGFWRGSRLAIARIFRCHPWHAGGHDPVPGLKSDAEKAIPAHYNSHFHG